MHKRYGGRLDKRKTNPDTAPAGMCQSERGRVAALTVDVTRICEYVFAHDSVPVFAHF